MLRIITTDNATIEKVFTEIKEWRRKFSRKVVPICQRGSEPSELDIAVAHDLFSTSRAVELLDLMKGVMEEKDATNTYYSVMVKHVRKVHLGLPEGLMEAARGRNEDLMQLAEEFEEELNWALVSHYLN